VGDEDVVDKRIEDEDEVDGDVDVHVARFGSCPWTGLKRPCSMLARRVQVTWYANVEAYVIYNEWCGRTWAVLRRARKLIRKAYYKTDQNPNRKS
jgi:hypothetical protein